MILQFLSKILGSANERALKKLARHVPVINDLEAEFEALSDAQLQAKTHEFRERLDDGESLDDLLHEAFATVREAAKRVLGQRHYDVQLIGGLVLHQGSIAEMKTGEGKTLVSTLAAYLNALPGKGVHVVTVNDYLAERDSAWMGKIYEFLGLSVGCILSGMPDDLRHKAYAADITYGTNNEFGFDYLKDNMKYALKDMVQRPFHYAIIDEIDSILIDEARTPLIISGQSESATELYGQIDKIIPEIAEDHYELDEKHKTIVLNEEGQEHVEQLLQKHGLLEDGGMYDLQNIGLVHHINNALRAHKIFHKDKDYLVKDGRVILIDEFTGRMKDTSRMSDGQHQALEAKEGVEIQTENQTLASITYQNYFRLYPRLSGMTGTALTEAAEFMEIYNLGVVAITTNVPIARQDHDDKIYKSLADKNDAIVELIKERQKDEQPCLVGTVSIEKSEQLSALLKKAKVKHNVLNARYHEQEAHIVAQAGRPGAVTIATNMAGRGTDIQLGGNLDMRIADEVDESWAADRKEKAIEKIKAEVAQDKQKVIDAGGLYVVGTERHESRRIDNQLRGRSGRQGDAGASMFFLSTEDDLMRVFAGDRLDALLNSKRIGLQDGEALEHPMISKLLERAQTKVEAQHFEGRKNVLKYDDVMNDQRKVIYEQRKEIMGADDIQDLAKDMRYEVIEDTVAATIPKGAYAEKWDIDALHAECLRLLGLDLPLADWAREEGIADDEILERIIEASDQKMASKVANVGKDVWVRMEKMVALQILDQHWKEHLLNLDHLRQGINLRAFGQKDPLNEYKTEAFATFEIMLIQMREAITQTLSLVEVNIEPDRIGLVMPGVFNEDQMQKSHRDPALDKAQQNQPESIVKPFPKRQVFDENDPSTWGKVQRNASCPCGSGKKFKHCHGSVQQTVDA